MREKKFEKHTIIRYCKTGDSGFSLVELMVVILVIGILAVAIAPQIMKQISAAQKNVCLNNLAEITNCYSREAITDRSLEVQQVIENKDQKYFSGKAECPTKGIYVGMALEDGSGTKKAYCMTHSDIPNRVNAATKTILVRMQSMSVEELREFLDITDSNFSNDNIRPKILELLGGEYEHLEKKVLAQLSEKNQTTPQYVQPMITSDEGKYQQYVLYTNGNDDDSSANKWVANTVFDPETGIWYERIGITYNLANKTYSEIMDDITKNEDNGWRRVNET